MNSDREQHIIALGKAILRDEARALGRLADTLEEPFYRAVQHIASGKGRVVVSGIGKSAIVARKIAATMNSTGTPSVFLHAADATHGDLGIIQEHDTVVILSKSGNTPEIKLLASLVKNAGFPLIALTSNSQSHLARLADIVLPIPLEREADPHNLAPTTSTTLQMAMGDALALAVSGLRGFTPDDFARYHPGGSLGKQLLLRVSHLIDGKEKPAVSPGMSVKDVIVEITENRVGATAVLDGNRLVGIITDGDIRRMLQKFSDINPIKARDIMSGNPKTVPADSLAVDALRKMKQNNISQLIVLDDEGQYLGIIHLHEILKEGIVL